MAQRDNLTDTQIVDLGVVSLSGTTAAASDWVDTRGYNSVTLYLMTNTVTAAGTAQGGFTSEMQEGDDSTAAGATAVADASIIGAESSLQITSDSDDDIIKGGLGYLGNKRYVRLNMTGTTGTSAEVRVIAVLMHPSLTPSAAVGTSVAAT